MKIAFIIIGVIIFLIVLASFIVYMMAFYNDTKNKPIAYEPLRGPSFDKYKDIMDKIVPEAMALPYKEVTIKSYDRKKLSAKLYITKDGAPFQIQCHGYKGSGVRDMAGGLPLALSMGFNVLLIDERGHGNSQGKTITFGIKERKDVKSWVNYVNDTFNNPIIYLVGVSMGAATVLMASSFDYKENVKGIIADCPYCSPKEIVLETSKKMKVPYAFAYPSLYLGALLFGHFKLNETDALKEVSKSKLPILIIHGTTDKLVPCEMSKRVAAINPNVRLVLVENAPHAMSYCEDYNTYSNEVKGFIERTIN